MTAPWHLTAAELDAAWDDLAAENAALRSRLAHAEACLAEKHLRLAEAERDRDAGWKAFYALREQVGRDRYPGLTNIVRTTDSASASPPDHKALYHELLFAVATKFPGETRHQTALRYIEQAEQITVHGPQAAADQPTVSKP